MRGGGGEGISLLEGSRASPANDYDTNSVIIQTYQEEEEEETEEEEESPRNSDILTH